MNLKTIEMDGISIIHDQTNDKKYVQISLEQLEAHQTAFEDLFDVIIAESRKNDKMISIEELTARLEKSGKL